MRRMNRQPWLSHRYEEEINRRTAAENEFVLLKKVRGKAGLGPRAGLGTGDAEPTVCSALRERELIQS